MAVGLVGGEQIHRAARLLEPHPEKDDAEGDDAEGEDGVPVGTRQGLASCIRLAETRRQPNGDGDDGQAEREPRQRRQRRENAREAAP